MSSQVPSQGELPQGGSLSLLGWIVAVEPCDSSGVAGKQYLVFIEFPDGKIVAMTYCKPDG